MTFCHFPATLWLYHGLTHCLFLACSSVIFPFRHIASELSKSLLGHDDREPGQRVNPWSILHSSFPSCRGSLSSLFPYPLTVNCFPYIPFLYLLPVVLWYYGMYYNTIYIESSPCVAWSIDGRLLPKLARRVAFLFQISF